MQSGFAGAAARLILGWPFLGGSCSLLAQEAGPAPLAAAAAQSSALPDAPVPQIELAVAVDPQSSQAQSTQQPASGSNPAPAASGSGSNNGAAQGSSSSQSSSAQPEPQETQHQKAAEQIKEQEKQRVAGIVPSFNVTYHSDAASMTAGQKIGLAFIRHRSLHLWHRIHCGRNRRDAGRKRRRFWLGPGRLLQTLRRRLPRCLRRRHDRQRFPVLRYSTRTRATSDSATAVSTTVFFTPSPPATSENTTTPASGSRTTPTSAATSFPAPSPICITRRRTPAGAKPSPTA